MSNHRLIALLLTFSLLQASQCEVVTSAASASCVFDVNVAYPEGQRWPDVSCDASTCSEGSMNGGKLYKKFAGLTELGMMVEVSYTSAGDVGCQLVPDVSATVLSEAHEVCNPGTTTTTTTSTTTTTTTPKPTTTTTTPEPTTTTTTTTPKPTTTTTTPEPTTTTTTPEPTTTTTTTTPKPTTTTTTPQPTTTTTTPQPTTTTTTPQPTTTTTTPTTTTTTTTTTPTPTTTTTTPTTTTTTTTTTPKPTTTTTTPTTTTTTKPPPKPTCPSAGWKMNLELGYCYEFNTDLQTWANAEASCVKEGAHLASMHSWQERYYIQQNLPGSSWFGMNDQKKAHTYVYTDGTPYNYSQWVYQEPSNSLRWWWDYASESCIEIHTSGYWNDVFCDETRTYVCKTAIVYK